MHCCLLGLGIGPGDEVVTTPFSFIASSNVIKMVGATPVFADIESTALNMDVELAAKAITPRTRAIMLNTPLNPCGRVISRAELEACGHLPHYSHPEVLAELALRFLSQEARDVSES